MDNKSKVLLLNWAQDIENNVLYEKIKAKLYNLFESSELFKQDILRASADVVGGAATPEALLEASNYLIKEFAFLTACKEMFGTSRLAYIYHKKWPVFEKYVEGIYDGEKKEQLGFLVLTSDVEAM